MNLRSTLLTILLVVLAVPSLFAQTLRARTVIGQNAVIPGCRDSGDELEPPTEIFADRSHVLSTTLDVTRETKTVPVYAKKNGVWTCSEKTFNLRLYRDPVSGLPQFPGPTLHVRRSW